MKIDAPDYYYQKFPDSKKSEIIDETNKRIT